MRVLVADDERLVRTGLRAILDAEPDIEVVGEAATGAEAVAAVRAAGTGTGASVDVVLMDVRMPELDGIRATELVAASGAAKVVVVTTFENDDYVYEALRAGASGFLLKRARPEEMVQAVRVVAAGESLLFPAALRTLARGRSGMGSDPGPASDPAPARGLTDREREVWRLVAAGLSNAEIAERMGVGPETVKSHVAALLAKLRVRDRTQAAIRAWESGFVRP
ncbi:DNA-binding response regulator [Mangrovactinospora gilvigrisea]|uniref:DNA-binding response regulator n=1 Tax=Mangrovactinospora gilvigrisea TaxID=1428644 RepID=A0A1J7BI04_9ACTN|nr:response regulator transcription factor [Mangrovactinospora gilvigrisea]OIV38213.1 DNA-binding response regulator [Mangrovactinospora gilvigrisea]